MNAEIYDKDSTSEPPASVLPVLSSEFRLCEECFQAMLRLTSQHPVKVLPITYALGAYQDVKPQSDQEHIRVSFLDSILNRANRIPANSNWDQRADLNLRQLCEVLRTQGSNRDTDTAAAMARRVPKFTALLGNAHALPVSGGCFCPGEGDHMEELSNCVKSQHIKLGTENDIRVIISHDGGQHSVEIANAIHADLSAADAQVTLLSLAADPAWFVRCKSSHLCVALLTELYLSSSSLESQLTFAKDYGKEVVSVVVDARWHSAMKKQGADFRSKDDEIVHLKQELERTRTLLRTASSAQ
eukprot:TRINITY_DN3535_c0_g2_i3.p2 TRINITY_DN3535_c0_g2~~TRINITY_DN3535_c0_g2_i3.p2  ORF type:complete len:300 (+),score=100.72 TRINITY_DN3535_c0_g2_i3:250-1149(+)